MGIVGGIAGLTVTAIASAMLIVLGLIYFMVTLWIIKVSSAWVGLSGVESGTFVLTAGIVSAASMIGSAIQQ
ncbi:hypothetical protein AUJ68_05355 [Candidatus Woesearchaeota archaeon CG1_02_57_44]|nr:MAG: hypothetical protein AUJ68_05355 [Candidatus Woesearchaeota archaeon CG1_02_57_44]